MTVSTQLRRKLYAINYPGALTFSATLEHLRHLIVWLEDRIIRIYPADKRLRDVNSDDWSHYVETYLSSLECPFSEKDILAVTDWMVSKALLSDVISGADNISGHTNAYVFPGLTTSQPIFQKSVCELSDILRIPNHPDFTETFKAICKLADGKLSKDAIETALGEYGKTKIEMVKASGVCLGFEVSDPEVRNAAVGLRLLNVNTMRRLQDVANSAIVQVQKLTADPITDEKLGKVGF